MSAPSFTPGPWRYDYEPGYCGEIIASNGELVAVFTEEPSEDDARLISAAPDLLEALEAYVTTMAIAGGGDKALFMAAIRDADNKARAALAKATGSQP